MMDPDTTGTTTRIGKGALLSDSVGRGQRAEGRGQRAEGRGQRAEGRGQRAEGRGQREEGRNRQDYDMYNVQKKWLNETANCSIFHLCIGAKRTPTKSKPRLFEWSNV